MFNSFSPNMLKTFDLCPKKFYFKYIKNISMPNNDEIFEQGKNIHALASYYLRKENIYKLEQALSEKERKLWDFLKETKYFSYTAIETEYNLSVKLENFFYGGRLDALVKDSNDTYYILDYKTGSAPKNAQYDFQTMVYMLAVSIFFKTDKVCFVYIDLKNKNEVMITFNEELKNEYTAKLTNIANKINSNIFEKKQKQCSCEYKIICY